MDSQPNPVPSFVTEAFSQDGGGSTNEDIYLATPIWYFRQLLTSEILDEIVHQSNLYALQKDVNKPLSLTRNELEQWLGLVFHFTVIRTPRTRMHWSGNLFGKYRDMTASIMSRDRWEFIKSCLHLRDNNDPVNNDKLFKVRPLVDYLRKKFQEIPKQQKLCVDEQMVPFKGVHSMKQYIPMKPKKWGFKFFVLADSGGIILDFIPYTGKIPPVSENDIPDLGPSSNIVLHFAKNIPHDQNHLLYFDNWFTSVPLIKYLAEKGIWSCGTVRPNRLPGLKLSDDSEMKKKGRGTFEEWKSVGEDNTLTVVKWYDNKGVTLISSFAEAKPVDDATRFDRANKRNIKITRPFMVKTYNENMGGVDLADCLLSLYRIPIRSHKYYHRLIFHMLDMVMNNAWLLYRRDYQEKGITTEKRHTLLSFRMSVSESLTKEGKDITNQVKRGRPSLTERYVEPPKKRASNQVRPGHDVRFDEVGHWPEVRNSRNFCKNMGCTGRTNVACLKCNVNLCLNNRNNCFLAFHKK